MIKKLNDELKDGQNLNKFEDYTFEQASKKLDNIILKLEKDNLGLEDSVELYEQGALLINICNKKLEKATGVITIIKNNIESSFNTKLNDKYDEEI